MDTEIDIDCDCLEFTKKMFKYVWHLLIKNMKSILENLSTK